MTSNDWWAKRLNTPAQQPPFMPQAPSQMPMQPAPSPAQQQPMQPQTSAPATRVPASAAASRCPGCGSGNYGGATPETRPRCYDCGYPITQTGTGMPGVNAPNSGPTQASRQVSTGGWNPKTIVDRIG